MLAYQRTNTLHDVPESLRSGSQRRKRRAKSALLQTTI